MLVEVQAYQLTVLYCQRSKTQLPPSEKSIKFLLAVDTGVTLDGPVPDLQLKKRQALVIE